MKFGTGFQLKGYTTLLGSCLPQLGQNEGVQCSECALVKSHLVWCWGQDEQLRFAELSAVSARMCPITNTSSLS